MTLLNLIFDSCVLKQSIFEKFERYKFELRVM